MAKSESKSSIFDLLPDEEKETIAQRLAETEAKKMFQSLIENEGTLGDLVDAIASNSFVDVLREVQLATVLAEEEKTKVKKPRAKRTVLGEDEIATVFDFVKKNGGKKAGEIEEGTGLDKKIVGRALAKLKKDGKVKTEGEKRATTYSAGK